eukprot:5816909-Amphidinium_carterae.1
MSEWARIVIAVELSLEGGNNLCLDCKTQKLASQLEEVPPVLLTNLAEGIVSDFGAARGAGGTGSYRLKSLVSANVCRDHARGDVPSVCVLHRRSSQTTQKVAAAQEDVCAASKRALFTRGTVWGKHIGCGLCDVACTVWAKISGWDIGQMFPCPGNTQGQVDDLMLMQLYAQYLQVLDLEVITACKPRLHSTGKHGTPSVRFKYRPDESILELPH